MIIGRRSSFLSHFGRRLMWRLGTSPPPPPPTNPTDSTQNPNSNVTFPSGRTQITLETITRLMPGVNIIHSSSPHRTHSHSVCRSIYGNWGRTWSSRGGRILFSISLFLRFLRFGLVGSCSFFPALLCFRLRYAPNINLWQAKWPRKQTDRKEAGIGKRRIKKAALVRRSRGRNGLQSVSC